MIGVIGPSTPSSPNKLAIAATLLSASSSLALLSYFARFYHHRNWYNGQSKAIDSESRAEEDPGEISQGEPFQHPLGFEKNSDSSRKINRISHPDISNDFSDGLQVHPIGTVHSIYRLCVGTPRQGMLAPHSRGILSFHPHKVSHDSLKELQHYSHVFVMFVFHLNSNQRSQNAHSSTRGTQTQQQQYPSKIAPPSLGGKKVGVFSTRTPHRPNPIGFSLCRLDKVIINNGTSTDAKNRKKLLPSSLSLTLLLSGLDIVDGTPILDVKPYVPHYDCVGYNSLMMTKTKDTIGSAPTNCIFQSRDDHVIKTATTTTTSITGAKAGNHSFGDNVRVPEWVNSGLQKRREVTFLPKADQFLQDLIVIDDNTGIVSSSLLENLQFYGPHSPWKDTPEEAVANLRNCIRELLEVDVRSAWQANKARRGKFQAERSIRVKNWKDDGSAFDAADCNNCTGDIKDENCRKGTTDEIERNSDFETDALCTQQIDNLLIHYTIEEPGSRTSSKVNGIDKLSIDDDRSLSSGAEDTVIVHLISFIGAKVC